MAAADLPAEIWVVIALIAALTVTMCLAVLASLHGHLMKARTLAEEVRQLRAAYSAAFKSVEFVDGPRGGTPGGAVDDEPARNAA